MKKLGENNIKKFILYINNQNSHEIWNNID